MRVRILLATILLMLPVPAQVDQAERMEPHPPAGPVAASWAILHAGFGDSSDSHRRQAVLAAAAIGPAPQALKLIEGALQDKSMIVRQTAAAALGELKAPQSIPYLRQALGDSAEVSFTAAKALTEMGDEEGRAVLQEVLTGERKDKPGFVERDLKHAKKKLTPAELAMMGVREASGALLGPASLGIVVAEEAIKGGKADKNEISGRSIAASVLAEHPDEYARMLLEWALNDSDSSLRATAAKGLARCGNNQSIPKLQAALGDEHAAVRYMAAAAIVRLSAEVQ
jgi:HEAT repeat protein